MVVPKRHLGQTGIAVSLLGLGTVKFGRNTQVKFPEAFAIPDDQQVSRILGLCQDFGINLIDTAPAYGSSEQRLGKLLPGARADWVICSKAGEMFTNNESHYDYTPKHIIKSVEQTLQRLSTDYLDILLIHSNGDDVAIIEQFDVFATALQLKQRGLIRSFGMSTKTVAGGLLTVAHADCVMACYRPGYTDELPVLTAADTHNKGVLIKKAFASGHLQQISNDNPIATTFEALSQQKAISSIIIGTINTEHLRDNCQKLCQVALPVLD